MADKVQKIREWIKARLDENTSKQSLPQFYGMMEEDARFLDFLDSLQEEPVSEDFDALDQLLAKYAIDFSYKGKTLKECSDRYKAEIIAIANHLEPVSEDLEEAASVFAREDSCDIKNPANFYYVVADKARIFKAGASWKKEEMMKDAVAATVHIDAGNYPYITQIELYDYDKDVPLAKEGDKYKVVLIKED